MSWYFGKKYINWVDFDGYPLSFSGKIKKSKKHDIEYSDYYITLDTETSHNHDIKNPIGWVYQWAVAINHDTIVYGRTPSQLRDFFDKLIICNNLNNDKRVVVYVHNLSYDYQYIKRLFDKSDMLAIDSHKLITFNTLDGIEFRCSYKLSNRSLDKWATDLNITHKKLSGSIDYDIIRYQDSKLNFKDWKYMFYDVIALDECVQKQMSLYHDDVLTIPLTSTGYVRREARELFNSDTKNKTDFKNRYMESELYQALDSAFAGGLTHGNFKYVNKIVTGTIRHRDFVSHYPSQQRFYANYPVGGFKKMNSKLNARDIIRLSKKYCLLMLIRTTSIILKQGVTLPCISYSKCKQGFNSPPSSYDFVLDNGRVFKLTGKTKDVYFDMWVTELDFKWLLKQYDLPFGFEIVTVFKADKGECPRFLQSLVDTYFTKKADLSKQITDVKMELKKTPKDDILQKKLIDLYIDYILCKNMLNGIYGMTATRPVRPEFLEDIYGEWHKVVKEGDDLSKALKSFYRNKKSFMDFALGVYCTSLARSELLHFVELIGYDNYIYCDTDSCFYLSSPEVERKIEEENMKLRREADTIGAYIVTASGKKVYYNSFEDEGEEISTFKFLHAKCYGYICNQKLNLTVAGVKDKGYKGYTRTKELGTLDNLTAGFVFKKCGGSRIVYNEHNLTKSKIDGHMTEWSSSAVIVPVEKTLSVIDTSNLYFGDYIKIKSSN